MKVLSIEVLGPKLLGACCVVEARGLAQRTQYPLIKEYTLNNRALIWWFKVYSLIKGYWDLWEGIGQHI